MIEVIDVFAVLWLLILEVARVFVYGFIIFGVLLLVFLVIVAIYEKLKGDNDEE